MAVAGRVAIRPSGAFDIETSYERLDMVKYQNTLFVAKKAASGVVPAEGEFWMDCGGTDLSDIEKKIRALEAPEFTEAEELEGLESKKPNGTLWGRVAKAVSSLIAHLGNKENPHKVTAAQTGALTKDNILNSTVATEAGQAAADAVQLNKEVEGSYAAGVAAEISEINADLAQLNTDAKMIILNDETTAVAFVTKNRCTLVFYGFNIKKADINAFFLGDKVRPKYNLVFNVSIVGVGPAAVRINIDGYCGLLSADLGTYITGSICGTISYDLA